VKNQNRAEKGMSLHWRRSARLAWATKTWKKLSLGETSIGSAATTPFAATIAAVRRSVLGSRRSSRPTSKQTAARGTA
jgi:hypothetical protein